MQSTFVSGLRVSMLIRERLTLPAARRAKLRVSLTLGRPGEAVNEQIRGPASAVVVGERCGR